MRTTWVATTLLIGFLLAPTSQALAGDDAPVVAVFQIEDSTKRKRRLIRSLTDYLRVKLAEKGTVKVVDKSEQRRQLKKILKREKRKSYRTCVDAACQIPLGKELAADKILRSRLTRFGNNFVITSEVLDLATEASAGAASAKSNGTPEGLMSAIEEIAEQLTANLVPPPPPPPPVVVAEVPPPPPPPMIAEPKVEMITPPPTGVELTLIVGGWVTFGGAYIAVIVGSLLSENLANAYYSLFPVVGPLFIELTRIDPVDGKPDRNILNFIDAGVQVLGALIAVLGHVLVETKEPVPATSVEVVEGVSLKPYVGDNAFGIAATF